MNLDEIVNKAIPISFPGVKCAATVQVERLKAERRREILKKEIQSLLEKQNAGSNNQSGMATGGN